MIPPVEIDGSFRYLGKMFSYTMGTDEIRNELEEELTSYLDKVDKLPLHPKNKLLIINKFVYNKLRWRLSVYHLSESWATKSLDGKVIHYVKRWLHFHQGANLTHLKLSVSKFGLGFQLLSDVLKYCKLSMRQVLFKSINKEIQDLFHLTAGNYIHTDSLIVNCEGRPRKELSNQIENNVLEHITTLKEQGTIMQIMRRVSSTKIISLWNKITVSMPKNIYVFIRKALIFSLPNNSNLKRWGKVESDSCGVCGTQRQTQLHMLANCSVAATEGRYTWRHDSSLFTLLRFLSQFTLYGFELYGDLDG